MKRFIIIDIETTGQNKKIHDIIQLGAVKLNDDCEIMDKFSVYIKPLTDHWCKKAEEIHKIQKDWILQNGKDCNLAFEEFEKWVGENPKDYILAAWGTYFDINFLVEQYEKIHRSYPFSYRTLDVASVVRFYLTVLDKTFPGEEKAAKKLNIEVEDASLHNGLYDAILSAKMLKEVFERLKKIREE